MSVESFLETFRERFAPGVDSAEITRTELLDFLESIRYVDLEGHGRFHDCSDCEAARDIDQTLAHLRDPTPAEGK